MPRTRPLADFTDDAVRGQRPQQIRCPRLAYTESLLDQPNRHDRIGKE
jgi:hypothetical protein